MLTLILNEKEMDKELILWKSNNFSEKERESYICEPQKVIEKIRMGSKLQEI